MSTRMLRPTASVLLDGAPHAVDGGTISLDAQQVPYANSTIELPLLPDETLEWLDPRNGVRCTVEGGLINGTPRLFDLGLRSRAVDHRAKTVTLKLASDEALLTDYRSLVDDSAPLELASSLRAVVNYALSKIDATLEPGGPDADVTPYWEVTNMHPNPRVVATTFGYQNGGGANPPTLNAGPPTHIRWTTTAAASYLIAAPSLTAFRVTPGRSYIFEIDWSAGTVGRTARAVIQWRNNGSAAIVGNSYGPEFVRSPDYQRLYVIATAPAGAEFAYPLLSTAGNTAVTTHLARVPMFYEGSVRVPLFSGVTADTDVYEYEWADPDSPDRSSSIRRPLVDSPSLDALTISAGQSLWDFLLTLTAASGMILYCDEHRAWRLVRPEDRTIGQQINVTPSTTSEGLDTLDRDDADAYVTGIAVIYEWTDSDGIRQRRVDQAGTPEKAIEVPIRGAYPGPGVAAAMLARRQGTGRIQDVTAVSQYDTTPGMSAQITLPGAPDTLGRVTSVEFDLRTGFMDLGTAGLIDVNPGDWLAVDPDLDWDDLDTDLDWEDY